MARRKGSAEEIIGKLRAAEVPPAQDKKACEVCRSIGATDQTSYRWRNEYGGLKVDQARLLTELERENARLRKAVSDLTLEMTGLRPSYFGPPAIDEGFNLIIHTALQGNDRLGSWD